MKQDRNLIPKVGVALVVSFLTYGWIVADHGATGSPNELFGIPGAILMFAAILATGLLPVSQTPSLGVMMKPEVANGKADLYA